MEKVTGIGGLFFRAKDPQGLAQWNQDKLGVSLTPRQSAKFPAAILVVEN